MRNINVNKIGKNLDLEKNESIFKLNIKSHKNFSNYLLAKSINIGYYLITPLLIGVFFGYWLDNFFKTKKIFLIFFLFFGIISTFYNLKRIVNELK